MELEGISSGITYQSLLLVLKKNNLNEKHLHENMHDIFSRGYINVI